MVAPGRKTVRWLLYIAFMVLAAGCHSGSKSGWSLTNGGSLVDYDRHAKRLEVRPQETSLPVGKQMLLLATIYDDENKPRRKRRVEWKIEGPGIILDVDEGGVLRGRGFKEDTKSAITFTETSEHALPPGVDNPLNQVVRAGQTWCVVTSAVEGQTIVHAYAPEIADSENNRVLVKLNWVDARWQFPQASTAKAGSEMILQTRITRHTDQQPAANYPIRYTLLNDGPSATLGRADVRTGKETITEIIVPTGADGLAKAVIAELKPDFGTNRVGIEVLRADPSQSGGYAVLAKAETKIDWQAPQVRLNIDVPKATAINQAFTMTYSLTNGSGLETAPMVLKTAIPAGLEVVSTSPRATADGSDLLWSLPSLAGNNQQAVQVVVRPVRAGMFALSGAARTTDNLTAQGTASVQVTESKLGITINGPKTALVGENLPYQIAVTNSGSGVATNVRVKAQFDGGLDVVGKSGGVETIIDKLEAGQSRMIPVALSPRQAGKSAVKAIVVADGNAQAESPAIGIDIRKPELKIEATGPDRGYINQDVTWKLRVFNPSDVPLSNVIVRADLPPDFTFRAASTDGRLINNGVEWNLGTMVGKQWTDLTVAGSAKRLGKTALTASVSAAPLDNRDGAFKTVSLVQPFSSNRVESAIEILGVPALQLEVYDSADPVAIGQKFTYTIRVKNAGTLPANQIEIVANIPPQVKATRAYGAVNGKIDGQRVTFPLIASLQPNLTSTYTIEVEGASEGDGRFRVELKSLSLGSPLASEEPTRILPKR
ncbi:MAG: DUF11 domain-containing protein [Planctomycetes bacterium]|nr:DUF11 domain-containing protein [Planctomycetota bacterium]